MLLAMPPIDRTGRVEDDERLIGTWLRPHPGEYTWYAPVRLPSGALGLCRVDVRLERDPSGRRVAWAVLARGGQVSGGAFDLPAVASWQTLVAVERLLTAAGLSL